MWKSRKFEWFSAENFSKITFASKDAFKAVYENRFVFLVEKRSKENYGRYFISPQGTLFGPFPGPKIVQIAHFVLSKCSGKLVLLVLLFGKTTFFLPKNRLHCSPIVSPDGFRCQLVTAARIIGRTHFLTSPAILDTFFSFFDNFRVKNLFFSSQSTNFVFYKRFEISQIWAVQIKHRDALNLLSYLPPKTEFLLPSDTKKIRALPKNNIFSLKFAVFAVRETTFFGQKNVAYCPPIVFPERSRGQLATAARIIGRANFLASHVIFEKKVHFFDNFRVKNRFSRAKYELRFWQ